MTFFPRRLPGPSPSNSTCWRTFVAIVRGMRLSTPRLGARRPRPSRHLPLQVQRSWKSRLGRPRLRARGRARAAANAEGRSCLPYCAPDAWGWPTRRAPASWSPTSLAARCGSATPEDFATTHLPGGAGALSPVPTPRWRLEGQLRLHGQTFSMRSRRGFTNLVLLQTRATGSRRGAWASLERGFWSGPLHQGCVLDVRPSPLPLITWQPVPDIYRKGRAGPSLDAAARKMGITYSSPSLAAAGGRLKAGLGVHRPAARDGGRRGFFCLGPSRVFPRWPATRSCSNHPPARFPGSGAGAQASTSSHLWKNCQRRDAHCLLGG